MKKKHPEDRHRTVIHQDKYGVDEGMNVWIMDSVDKPAWDSRELDGTKIKIEKKSVARNCFIMEKKYVR